MTELYLEFVTQSAAMYTAYTWLALFGSGLVLAGFALQHIIYSVFPRKLADLFLWIYAGGILFIQMAGLVILPFLNLD